MSPEEERRVLAEEWPDGRFGGPRPAPARRPRSGPLPPVTAEEAARHREQLLAALDAGPDWPVQPAARHLHIVTAPDRQAS